MHMNYSLLGILLASSVSDEAKENVTETIDKIEKIWKMAEPAVWALVKIILVFAIGRRLIKLAIGLLGKWMEKSRLERGVSSFLSSLTKGLLYAMLIIVIAGIVGIPTASFVAVLGSCGLAVGLALQGSLQNFAGGVLILVMKPFIVGDYIKVGEYEGFVHEIDICYTKLRTFDNRITVLPNGSLSNSNLVNISREPKRRIDITVPISYSDDFREVQHKLMNIAANCDKVLQNENNQFVLDNFGESCIEIQFRVWCKTSDYWPTRYYLYEEIKKMIDSSGFTIPFNQLDVHIKDHE